MSLRGQINKVTAPFMNTMRNAAMKGNVDAEGGIHGTRKIYGYVCFVHPIDDEEDELRGTVDVQETDRDEDDWGVEEVGLHKGVLCSAIQANNNGMVVMPSFYSDVVIVQDPVSFHEYVLMCSHVDNIRLQSHENVSVGVVETEPFVESDDDDKQDVENLAETGNAAYTAYTKEAILHTVKTKNGDIVVKQTADTFEIIAQNSKISLDGEGKVVISANDVTVKGTSTLKVESPSTVIDGNKVEVTGSNFIRKGTANLDGQGGFCGIPVCPFTGAVHTGSTIIGG